MLGGDQGPQVGRAKVRPAPVAVGRQGLGAPELEPVAQFGLPFEGGEVLDLGYLKCIDTFCHGGGWLTALEVEGGWQVWQANLAGEMRE